MRNRYFLLSLVAPMLVSLMFTGVSGAQTARFKGLHTFGGGSDGRNPGSPLVFDAAGNLYGTTGEGGTGACSGGCGTVFELVPSGSNWKERILYNFPGPSGSSAIGPLLVDKKGNVYGTTAAGGDPSCNCGEVYQLAHTTGGWTLNIIHSFLGGASDGQYPRSGLVRDNAGNLYGSTQVGGMNGNGTIFELSPNADGTWTESVIHAFGGSGVDGYNPIGALTIDVSGNLYGTTSAGGLYSYGAVFKLTLTGAIWTETVVYNFTLDFGLSQQPDSVAIDGAGNLYGATLYGGEYGLGTVYKLTPTIGYWNRTVLHTFTGASDGAYAQGGLTIDSTGALYGAAGSGGIYGYGVVYKLAQGGNGRWSETVLHSFKSSDGSDPFGGMVLDQLGNLYGTTILGGAYGVGVAFEIVP